MKPLIKWTKSWFKIQKVQLNSKDDVLRICLGYMRTCTVQSMYMADIMACSVSLTCSTWPASAARPITDTMPKGPVARPQSAARGITFQPLNAPNKHVPLATVCQYPSTKSPLQTFLPPENTPSEHNYPFSRLIGNRKWQDITRQNILAPNGTTTGCHQPLN